MTSDTLRKMKQYWIIFNTGYNTWIMSNPDVVSDIKKPLIELDIATNDGKTTCNTKIKSN